MAEQPQEREAGGAAMRCPGCGRANDCAIAAGGTSCWCMELPPAKDVAAADAACFCRRCLTQREAANGVISL